MTNLKIAFFDIDGTLADNNLPKSLPIFDRIPESAKEALARLQKNGIETVIATGRNYGSVAHLAQKLKVSTVISSNGNQITYHHNTIFQYNFPDDMLTRVIAELDRQHLDFLIETPRDIYYYPEMTFRGDSKLECVPIARSEPLPVEVLQLICHAADGQIELGIDGVIAEKVAPVVANIHDARISKASGIHELLTRLKISPADAVAFGDEENDLQMFEAVGLPIAMENATPRLKKKAKLVTDSVENDGIWKACLKLGLFKK